MKHREMIKIFINRYTLNNLPTCSASTQGKWSCEFLSTKRFGQEFECRYINKEVFYEEEKEGMILKPHKDCPLWKSF